MGRKLRAEQHGVFPGNDPNRHRERDRVLGRAFAKRAGLPDPERERRYENLGNRDLPVWKKKREIQETIRDNQISMVEGPTGSGKSTQVAQYALEMGYRKIVYLEPRVPLADNVSDRFIVELTEQLGSGIGSQLVGVRHSERSSGYGKTIEVMTPDTFLRVFHELDPYGDEPVLIVGDEIHEKDFPTELAVAVAAKSLPDHSKWRLALMSATLDAKPIQEAYGGKLGRSVPLVSVEGRPFDLEAIEEPELTVEEAYEKYRDGHTKAQLFTAGKEEIRELTSAVKKKNYPNTRVTPFHAKLPRARILQATQAQLRDNEKQVIPSTNAGSSGITIPGQTLVISDGTVRRQDLDLDGTPGLFKQECAQDELTQQAGRAGRDVGGGLFVLARPDDEDNFAFMPHADRPLHAPAQIYHTNISRNVLATTALGYDFYELNDWLLHGVNDRIVIEAYDTLYRLGAIDEQNELTELGQQMNKFPVRPELARTLVAATVEGAEPMRLHQIAATVAAIEAGGLPYFERGIGSKWREDVRLEVDDDYMAQLDMFIATRQFYHRELLGYEDGIPQYGTYVDEAELEERNYDLRQTEKAHKTYDKICRTFGIGADDELLAPSVEQIEELREYLAVGLFDYAHERVSSADSSRKTTYASIYDADHARPRTLTDRGVYKGSSGLVIGFPRRFEKRVKGGPLEEFSVIENVTPTTADQLARAAVWLANVVPRRPDVRDGRLVQVGRQMLGTVQLGETEIKNKIVHTPETRALLREAAFAKPTQALSELIDIKKELESLARLVPDDEFHHYLSREMLTQDWLTNLITEATDNNVDTIYALDNNLRRYMVVRSISREAWISDEIAREILQRSPESILVGSEAYTLYYSHGVPIINGFNLRDADALPSVLMLEDGREVLINYKIGNDTKRHSAEVIKAYASTL